MTLFFIQMGSFLKFDFQKKKKETNFNFSKETYSTYTKRAQKVLCVMTIIFSLYARGSKNKQWTQLGPLKEPKRLINIYVRTGSIEIPCDNTRGSQIFN